jgi:purine-binding chemotaxis protein CheW
MSKQVVIFKLNNEDFCVDIMQVLEILSMQKIRKVPDVPDFIEGIFDLRGAIIPIIDLRKKFNMEKTNINDNTRIIVVNLNKKSVGFIVDAVAEVLHIDEESIKEPPDIISGIGKEYIEAVVKLNDRLIIDLNLHRVLTEQEKKEIEEMG